MVLRLEMNRLGAGFDLASAVVRNQRLSPAEAEVRITLSLLEALPAVEIRGRLTGPRCVYASTVEVAYPFRALPPSAGAGLTAQVVIPEPSLWEPSCPFLYQGPLELWQSGTVVCRMQMSHGLRRLQLGPRGLLWNGQPLLFRGTARSGLEEGEANTLRQQGLNGLLLAGGDLAAACAAADRLGFLVLARLAGPEASLALAALGGHACFLGGVVAQEWIEKEPMALARLGGGGEHLLGVELTGRPTAELPPALAFVCCRADLLPVLEQVRLPKIVLTDGKHFPSSGAPGILGWAQA